MWAGMMTSACGGSSARLVSCGKTTWLARQCQNVVAKYGDRGALVVSLTKAAAREAGGRDTGLDASMVGTLHSHCYRGLGSPTLLTREHIVEWNRRYPESEMDPAGFRGTVDDVPELGGNNFPGDELHQTSDLFRHQLRDVSLWPTEELRFHKNWTAFKESVGAIDFTDMIERAVTDVPLPPGSPSVLFADEAQDLSRLELSVLTRWMRHVEHLVLVGDPDQAIYGWRGSDPQILDGERFKVLEQSYRVPRAVHAAAVELIGEAHNRQPVVYLPKAEEGWVDRSLFSVRQPARLVEELAEYADRGHSVMFLALSAYLVAPIEGELRRQGIPFHNPYTPRWNPLAGGAGISTARRILAFLDRDSIGDLKLFAPLLAADGVLRRGGKKRLEGLGDEPLTEEQQAELILALFTDETVAQLWGDPPLDIAGSVEWLRAHILASRSASIQFPLDVLERGGRQALEETPRICIGTCHSVKGGEADVVVVAPDLPRAALENYNDHETWYGRDSILRLFYVALTRAKQGVVITQPIDRRAYVQELAA